MIDKQTIQNRARLYASYTRVAHHQTFYDGAMWALEQLGQTHNTAADLIEKLRSENAKQLELIRVQSECLCSIIKSFQENGE